MYEMNEYAAAARADRYGPTRHIWLKLLPTLLALVLLIAAVWSARAAQSSTTPGTVAIPTASATPSAPSAPSEADGAGGAALPNGENEPAKAVGRVGAGGS